MAMTGAISDAVPCAVIFTRKIPFLIFSIIAWIVFALAWRTYPPYVIGVGLILTCLGFASGVARTPFFYPSVLGFLLATIPFFGRGELSVFVLAFIVGREVFRRGGSPLTGLCSRSHEQCTLSPINLGLSLLVVYFAGSTIVTLVVHGDFSLLFSSLFSGSVDAWRRYLAVNSLPEHRALFSFFQVVLFVLLSRRVALDSSGDKALFTLRFLRGLFCGLLISSLFALAQWQEAHPFFSHNLSRFWSDAHRVAGAFSDPNAFGVFLGVCCGLFFHIWSLVRVPLVAKLAGVGVVFIAGMQCGSRSLFLAMVLWLGYGVFCFLKNRQKELGKVKKWGLMLLGLGGIVFPLLCLPVVNEFLMKHLHSPTLQRVLMTLNVNHLGEMLYSRLVFWRIALALWWRNPWIGVGQARFVEAEKSVTHELGIDLGGWVDNANNLYLEVLAEGGLLGFIIFVSALILISVTVARNNATKSTSLGQEGPGLKQSNIGSGISFSLLVFLILGITGPHHHFEEISFLVAIFLGVVSSEVGDKASSFYSSWNVTKPVFVFLGVLYITLACLQAAFLPLKVKGLYASENSIEGVTRWSVSSGQLGIKAERGEEMSLEIQAAHPDVSTSPVRVQFSALGSEKKVAIDNNRWQTISLGRARESGCIPVQWQVDRLWSPAQYSDGWVDRRWFGIKIRWGDVFCGRP